MISGKQFGLKISLLFNIIGILAICLITIQNNSRPQEQTNIENINFNFNPVNLESDSKEFDYKEFYEPANLNNFNSAENYQEIETFPPPLPLPFKVIENKENENIESFLEIQTEAPEKRERRFPCFDKSPRSWYGHRGNFTILYNYFQAGLTFDCDETITYTTIADYTFLENLPYIVDRWRGPISLVIYAPGTDFESSVEAMIYLRECINSTIVKSWVNVHIIFDTNHMPSYVEKDPFQNFNETKEFCELILGPEYWKLGLTYRRKLGLRFPINVARNLAREMSTTFYVLPSDIELFPSRNVIPQFFEMLGRNKPYLHRKAPKVFVLPVFEVDKYVERFPDDKKELVQMLKNGSAISYHDKICKNCHMFPLFEKWIAKKPKDDFLSVYEIIRREGRQNHWTPFFIGTVEDPTFDERLTWEGPRNRNTQGLIFCLLGYEYMIFDNAFMVHRPGFQYITAAMKTRAASSHASYQNYLIDKVIVPELNTLYGYKKQCFA